MEFHLRFGMQSDKEIIHQHLQDIDGLVVPAHILAHQAAATSVFVTSLMTIPYIVDPMTFVLQNPKDRLVSDQNNGKLRPSVKKMCHEYHPDLVVELESLTGKECLDPTKLPPIRDLCKGIVKFQQDKVKIASQDSKAKKYLDRYTETSQETPRAILPPYFRFESTDDDWYKTSKRCAEETAKLCGDETVAPVVCCPIGTLDDQGISTISDAYTDFTHIILWIDNFNQYQAKEKDIGQLRKLIQRLSRNGKCQIEILYGGYLMIMMEHDGLSALSCGILYTEHKSYELVPGSKAVPERYYLPGIRAFRSLSQSDAILHRLENLMCECPICEKVMEGKPDKFVRFADERPSALLRKHFLAARSKEVKSITSRTPADEVKQLRADFERFNKTILSLPNPDAWVSKTKMVGLDYLNEWAEAFSDD